MRYHYVEHHRSSINCAFFIFTFQIHKIRCSCTLCFVFMSLSLPLPFCVCLSNHSLNRSDRVENRSTTALSCTWILEIEWIHWVCCAWIPRGIARDFNIATVISMWETLWANRSRLFPRIAKLCANTVDKFMVAPDSTKCARLSPTKRIRSLTGKYSLFHFASNLCVCWSRK